MRSQLLICTGFLFVIKISFAQNVGVNNDGTAPETNVMLDVKGANPVTTTSLQNIFQIKSNNASSDALKLRLGLGTNATATSRYGVIDVPDYVANSVSAYRALALQPSGGNVGIGMTNPSWLLDATLNQNGYTLFGIRNNNNGGNACAGIVCYNDANAIGTFGISSTGWNTTGLFPTLGTNRVFLDANSSASGMVLNTESATPIMFTTANTERARIDGNGNVGIGTISPSSLLEIKGAGASPDMLRLTSTSGRPNLTIGTAAGNANGPVINIGRQGANEFAIYLYNGAPKLAFYDASTANDVLTIMGGKTTIGNGSGISGANALNVYGNMSIGTTYYNSGAPANGLLVEGYVGIGTTAPKSPLHVTNLPVYANNAAALAGGLTAGAFYRTGGDPDLVCVVH